MRSICSPNRKHCNLYIHSLQWDWGLAVRTDQISHLSHSWFQPGRKTVHRSERRVIWENT